MRAVAADVGGTRTRLALVDLEGGRPRILDLRETRSRDHDGAADLVARYLDGLTGDVDRIRLAVAGPVEAGRVELTNLDWVVDQARVADATGVADTRVVNDFAAVARALPLLGPDDYEELQPGTERPGPAALLGAGTGLGEAFLIPDRGDGAPRVLPSEGGHVDFAPCSPVEADLLRYLWGEFDHVSYERILSGPGLEWIYRFLVEREGREVPHEVREALGDGGAAPVVARRAREGGDPLAGRALDLFVSVYGAQAGNLGLVVRAHAGVWLAGGIAPRILPRLREGPFLEAFRAKGRFREYLETVPVRVVTETRAGILGAAAWE